MKAKQNKTNAIDFTSLLPFMEAVHKAEVKLMDALLAVWHKQDDKSNPMAFRRAFVEFAVSKGYTARWAGEVACDAGFRVRAAGGGRKASDKPKATAGKPTKASDVDLSQMPKSELVKLMANIAARL
jgi:hypothetical protein